MKNIRILLLKQFSSCCEDRSGDPVASSGPGPIVWRPKSGNSCEMVAGWRSRDGSLGRTGCAPRTRETIHEYLWVKAPTRCNTDKTGGNSDIFYFHPDPWGNDPIWRVFSRWVGSTTNSFTCKRHQFWNRRFRTWKQSFLDVKNLGNVFRVKPMPMQCCVLFLA